MNRRAIVLGTLVFASLVLWSCGNDADEPVTGNDPASDVALTDIPTLSDLVVTLTPVPPDTPEPTATADPNAIATDAAPSTAADNADAPVSSSGDPAAIERGQSLAQQCLGCHSIDGSQLVGPTWQGLYGRDVTLTDGTTVTADKAYITQSIRDPGSQIVEGFPPSMPPFSSLTDQDIADIIAYIQSLAD